MRHDGRIENRCRKYCSRQIEKPDRRSAVFLLVRADGTVESLPGVFAIENDGTGLFCLDAMGAIVGRYTPQEVLLYGDDSRILPLLAEYADSGSRTQKLTLDGHAEPC